MRICRTFGLACCAVLIAVHCWGQTTPGMPRLQKQGSATQFTVDGKPFLAVEDTGPGIPADERQRVRQRFYRMPNSPGHGSGLGLAIVDEIARIHDATVDIGSGAGGLGTKVLVQFP